MRLPYGYDLAVPIEKEVAWGAVAKLDDDGQVYLEPDRVASAGGTQQQRELLEDRLDSGILALALDQAARVFFPDGTPSSAPKFGHADLYQDRTIKVAGNLAGTIRHVYIAAWLREGDK